MAADYTGKSVLENLECCMCKSNYKDPRKITCGHSFCLNCLQQHIDHSVTHGKTRTFSCPLCKTEVIPVDPSENKDMWAKAFPVHVLLQNSVRIVEMGNLTVPDYEKCVITDNDIHLCTIHKKALDVYCLYHRTVVCERCVWQEHNLAACKIVPIRDTLAITEEMTKSLTKRFKRRANIMKSNSSTFLQREKILKSSLDAVFQRLDLIANNLDKLVQHYVEEIQNIRRDATELYENIKFQGVGKSTYWSMLRNAKSVLSDIKKSDDCIWIHKTLKILEAQAEDLEREMDTNFKLSHTFQLEFSEDKGMNKLIKNPPPLGTVRARKIQIQNDKMATMTESADELESTVVSSSRKILNDRFKFKAVCDDESECLLSAISCIDGKVVVSDNENGRVKLFSSDGAFIDAINIPDCCGLCVLPKTKSVIVSQPDEQLISILEVNNNQRPSSGRSSISGRKSSAGSKDSRPVCKEKCIKLQRVLKTSKKYSALCSVSTSTFAAASCELPIPGVDIISGKGEIVKSIINPSTGKPYFKNPQNLSTNSKGVIVIADSALNRLVEIDISGEIPAVSFRDTGTRPSGIFIDEDGNSILCQIDRNTVRYYNRSGENYLLVKKKHRVRNPLTITVSGNYLYLTEEYPSKNIVRFTITKDNS